MRGAQAPGEAAITQARRLHLAKLARAALYETTARTWSMRFHDLRATFETRARRAGGTSTTSTRGRARGRPIRPRGALPVEASVGPVPKPGARDSGGSCGSRKSGPVAHPVGQSGGFRALCFTGGYTSNLSELLRCEGGDLKTARNTRSPRNTRISGALGQTRSSMTWRGSARNLVRPGQSRTAPLSGSRRVCSPFCGRVEARTRSRSSAFFKAFSEQGWRPLRPWPRSHRSA